MGLFKPDTPIPPDPVATSAAQTGTNVATAVANQHLGQVNQVSPDGSINYTQNGTTNFNDPYTHTSYDLPNMTQTTTLSPTGQVLHDTNNKTKVNLSNLALDQSSSLAKLLSKPFDGTNNATEARLMQLGRQRLDPILADRTQQLNTSLSNQGIKLGSTAYDKAMLNDNQSKNDAYNSLLLNGHSQAYQEGYANYTNPINIINSLQSGSQVQMPQFSGVSTPQMSTTDNAALINNNYAQRVANANSQYSAGQSTLGGLFGLGAAGIASDRRLKKDIIKIGMTAKGYAKYVYRYLFAAPNSPYHKGYMADEVANFAPNAVLKMHGYLALDYSALEAL